MLFTLSEGACPTYSVHLYCYGTYYVSSSFFPVANRATASGCNTNYQHDHYVRGDKRTYYEGVPDVIQVGEHQFVEREVQNLFTGLMLLSW